MICVCVAVGLVGGGGSPPPGPRLCILSPAGWLPRVRDQLRPLMLDNEYGKPLRLPLVSVAAPVTELYRLLFSQFATVCEKQTLPGHFTFTFTFTACSVYAFIYLFTLWTVGFWLLPLHMSLRIFLCLFIYLLFIYLFTCSSTHITYNLTRVRAGQQGTNVHW